MRSPISPMRRRAAWLPGLLLAAPFLLPAPSQAEPREQPAEPLEVRVVPWPTARQGEPRWGDHFKRLLELQVRDQAAEVVADRRLLELTVRPEDSRRRYRCRHPDRPRRVEDARVRQLGPGEVYREWIDLRMYCWGRALDALTEGQAEVEIKYGFPGRNRRRWVFRRDGEDPSRVARVEGEGFVAQPAPERTRAPAPVRVEMAPASVARARWLTFRVAAMASEPGERIRLYVRPDQWAFRVTGPVGEVRCGMRRVPRNPVVDFFDTITRRVKVRMALDSHALCPEGTFDVAGVYDVTPILELPYGGEEYGLDAAKGTVEGVPTPVRVLKGEVGYVDQAPEARPGPRAGEEAPAQTPEHPASPS